MIYFFDIKKENEKVKFNYENELFKLEQKDKASFYRLLLFVAASQGADTKVFLNHERKILKMKDNEPDNNSINEDDKIDFEFGKHADFVKQYENG